MLEYSAAATGITPISFLIAGMDSFIDLERSYLEVELRLNSNGKARFKVDSDTHAWDGTNTRWTYVTNNVGHTLCKQMNLYLNGMVMSAQTNMYAYQAFLETLLNYMHDEGETLLVPQGWVNYLDVAPSLPMDAGTTIRSRQRVGNIIRPIL